MRSTSLAISQGINVDRGFAAFQVPQSQNLNRAVDSLSDQPQIANTIPVMVDQEGLIRYFLPDEFTVQFKPEVTKEQADRIIKKKEVTSWFNRGPPDTIHWQCQREGVYLKRYACFPI